MTIGHVFEAEATTITYPIRYSIWDYTFPSAETVVSVSFDSEFIHIGIADGRRLSLPLDWIPPLRDASYADRQAYYIADDGSAIIWDPEESSVNEILRLSDYLHVRAK